jgi:O-acetyl-ADP-ribose deacetylase (regulator of RNase III)
LIAEVQIARPQIARHIKAIPPVENENEFYDLLNIFFSYSLPAIFTCAFGYPMKEAAEIALSTIIKMTRQYNHLKFIRVVLYNHDDFNIHSDMLNTFIE